jgi:hypothetical protein
VLVLALGLASARELIAGASPSVWYVRLDSIPGSQGLVLMSPAAAASASPEAADNGTEPNASVLVDDLPEPAPVAEPLLATAPDSVPVPARYTVQGGDSLAVIARRLGTTVAALRLVNDLDNPNLLWHGQILVVPPAQSTIKPVDPAQTLNDLAPVYGLDPALLATYNGLALERGDAPLDRPAILIPADSVATAPGIP